MDLSQITTFAANARHAVRSRESVTIGGGVFNPTELATIATALDSLEAVVSALNEISEILVKHPEFERGNSTVHYCAHKAQSALGNFKTEGWGNGLPQQPAPANMAMPLFIDATQKALQLIKDNWPYEHGQKQVGEAWGACAAALKSVGLPS